MSNINKVLVLGSGGREHVFVWKLAQELTRENLFVTPGNGGVLDIATCVNISINDFEALGDFCLQNQIDCVLPGSEDPLVNGIVDYFKSKDALSHIYVFGPSKEAAKLEGSKAYCKAFMQRQHIPTAAYQAFNASQLAEAFAFLESLQAPYVLKADGLAAGKGVLIIASLDEAKHELENMLLKNKFGAASQTVVIEEFLQGIEFSVFIAMDGKNYKVLPEAKDYKRIGEQDTGLNTGGMGAVSPVTFVDDTLWNKVIEQIVDPTVKGLNEENFDYNGFVFFGLINDKGNPKVIEYNVRMGDPETEVVFPRIKSSFLSMLKAAKDKKLNDYELIIAPTYCSTVFAVSGGYPEAYAKNKTMQINPVDDTLVFHAGTTYNNEKQLVTSGGRVVACTGFGVNLTEALAKSYEAVQNISFENMVYRKDIGKDLM